MGALADLNTPIAFSLSTLAVLWSFAGGNVQIFWQRTWVLAILLVVVVVLTASYSLPVLRDLTKKETWQEKGAKTALIAGLVMAIPFSAALFFLHSTSATSLPWIAPYVQSLPKPSWYSALLLPVIIVPLWELYWRGIISPQWGTFTTAFLEGLIWGFAAQHLLFFLAAMLSSLLTHWLIYRPYGIRASIIAKASWTFLMMITLLVM